MQRLTPFARCTSELPHLLAPDGVRAEDVAEAIKHGGSDASSPPFSPVAIVARAEALLRDRQFSAGRGSTDLAQRGFRALTYRERQVLQYIVDGRTNKEIALDLGLSYRTVEVHRRNVLKKTGAKNTADFLRSMES